MEYTTDSNMRQSMDRLQWARSFEILGHNQALLERKCYLQAELDTVQTQMRRNVEMLKEIEEWEGRRHAG